MLACSTEVAGREMLNEASICSRLFLRDRAQALAAVWTGWLSAGAFEAPFFERTTVATATAVRGAAASPNLRTTGAAPTLWVVDFNFRVVDVDLCNDALRTSSPD